MENFRYARPIDNKNIEYAPKMFKENGSVIVPRSDDDYFFFQRGYYLVVDNKPYHIVFVCIVYVI